MPEERKPAPLPPEPWKVETEWPWAVTDADEKQIACIYHHAVRDLLLRAPALEAERDDANMQATANNEVATSLHEQLKDAHALLRELTAAVEFALKISTYAGGPMADGGYARLALEKVLRRVEAEAGEENANG